VTSPPRKVVGYVAAGRVMASAAVLPGGKRRRPDFQLCRAFRRRKRRHSEAIPSGRE